MKIKTIDEFKRFNKSKCPSEYRVQKDFLFETAVNKTIYGVEGLIRELASKNTHLKSDSLFHDCMNFLTAKKGIRFVGGYTKDNIGELDKPFSDSE